MTDDLVPLPGDDDRAGAFPGIGQAGPDADGPGSILSEEVVGGTMDDGFDDVSIRGMDSATDEVDGRDPPVEVKIGKRCIPEIERLVQPHSSLVNDCLHSSKSESR